MSSKKKSKKKDVFSAILDERMDLTEPELPTTEAEQTEQELQAEPTEQTGQELQTEQEESEKPTETIEPVEKGVQKEQLPDVSVEKKGNAFLKWFSSVMASFRGMQKGTRNGIIALSAVGAVFAIAVIVLAVHLDKAKKEIKSVQAVSLSLQEELNIVKSEQEEMGLQLFGIETVFSDEVLMKVPEPTPEPAPEPTLKPVPTLTPTPEPPKYVVCIDAGHGGKDGGAVLQVDGVDKRVEKKDNLRMAKWFRDALQEYEIQVVMTRDSDTFLDLSERTDIANEANADVLVSFHRNSLDGRSDVGGVEFWIHSSKPEKARTLAQSMLDAITEVGGMNNRGVKSGRIDSIKENYAINKEAEMTSMIVELGFITSEEDNAAYDSYGEQYAKEMAKVVYEWLAENIEKE